ncbi:MAG: hypothetical protein JSV90_04120 [Methanobacteriota archaeon]|nr:MAG: hypothetical protein JSV90_04120 [Euryarchaeota archaeon]
MESGSPEAGLPIDRDMILVITLSLVLVKVHGARTISIKFLIDSHRLDKVDGHYEMQHELKDGTQLRIRCKEYDGNMMIKVLRNGTQLSYSVPVDEYVSGDLVPVSMDDFEELVAHWLNDLQ